MQSFFTYLPERTTVARFTRRTTRTLVPIACLLAAPLLAHAQGTMDTTQISALAQNIETTIKLVAAVVMVIAFCISAFGFMSGRISQGVIGVVGVVIGAFAIGFAGTWSASLTGQSVSMLIEQGAKVVG